MAWIVSDSDIYDQDEQEEYDGTVIGFTIDFKNGGIKPVIINQYLE